MEQNIDSVEGGVRIVFGLILLGFAAFAFYFSVYSEFWVGLVVSVVGLAGAYLLVTGGIRRCVLRNVIDIESIRAEEPPR